MENASKALIIAGAILISIVLIGVGMAVMNAAAGPQEGMAAEMDALEQQQFNSKFESYVSTKAKGSSIKALYSTAITTNNVAEDDSKKIAINGKSDVAELTKESALIVPSAYYTVTIEKYSTYGLIENMKVDRNK